MDDMVQDLPADACPPLRWPEDTMDIVRLLRADANRLGVFRAARGWTQQQAADFVGVNLRTWADWENGRRPIRGSKAALVASELKGMI